MVTKPGRKSWNIRTLVIDSFATFLLSYVKVLSVISDVLIFFSSFSLQYSL